jgi:hypothetical protein
MAFKRLGIAALACTLGIAVLGGVETSIGQAPGQDRPGTTYGGVRNFESVWIRLDESRNVILDMEIPWDAAGNRCSNRKSYSSALYTGAEYSHAIAIRRGGAFAATVVDRYRQDGIRYVETQIVKGTLTNSSMSGTIQGKAERTLPSGQVVRCTFGPLNWRAAD